MNGKGSSILGGILLVTASTSWAALPSGSYLQSCSNAVVGTDNVLKAKCRTMSGALVDTSLHLPCAGSIDNINGKLTCSGAPAAGVPQGSYLQSCGDARVTNNVLTAKCRRANQTVADASLNLPCSGKIDNLNGRLVCVGGSPTPGAPAAPPTPVSCAAGTVLLDGKSCVTLTPWPAGVVLPDGSKIAIRTRKIMLGADASSKDWVRWVGVSPKDSSLLDAVDQALTSRNVFEIRSFSPGAPQYRMPWFTMKTSTGSYAGRKADGGGQLSTTWDADNADLFTREGDTFKVFWAKWKDRQATWDRVRTVPMSNPLCLSPVNASTTSDSVQTWVSGPGPGYECYKSGDVDFFQVK